jgi:hypothetical protein
VRSAGGAGLKVEKIFFVQNQAQSAVRYVMDPIEQLHAFEWIESNGMDLLGIFHSHPADLKLSPPLTLRRRLMQLSTSSLRAWMAGGGRGFWIENGDYREVTLQIT